MPSVTDDLILDNEPKVDEPKQKAPGSDKKKKSGADGKKAAQAAKDAAKKQDSNLSPEGKRSLATAASGGGAGKQGQEAVKDLAGGDKAAEGATGEKKDGKEKDKKGKKDGDKKKDGSGPGAGSEGGGDSQEANAEGGAESAGGGKAGKQGEGIKEGGKEKGGGEAAGAPLVEGGPGTFDVDLIAREYAAHEAWQAFPDDGKNEIVKQLQGDNLRDAGGATLSVEQRKALLADASARGVGGGLLDAGIGFAIGKLMTEGLKFAAKKGGGKAIPFVGVAFGVWDIYNLFKNDDQGKDAFDKMGESWSGMMDSSAPDIDRWIAFASLMDGVFNALSAVVGLAGGICAVIAVLTSWTLIGGVSFGAAAAILTAVSVGLTLASAAMKGLQAYLLRQKVLNAQGDPQDVMEAVAAYENSLRGFTGGSISGGLQAKRSMGDIKGLQTKTRVDAQSTFSQSKTKASASSTSVKGFSGSGGKPSVVATNKSRSFDHSTLDINKKSTTVSSKPWIGGKKAAPTLDYGRSTTRTKATNLHMSSSKSTLSVKPAAGPVTGVQASHKSASVSHTKTSASHSQTTKRMLTTKNYDMANPKKNLEIRSNEDLLGTRPMGYGGLSTPAQQGVNPDANAAGVVARTGSQLQTNDPNTVYKVDTAGTAYLERRLPLVPQPMPPFLFPLVAERADRITKLAQREQQFVSLLGMSETTEAELAAELGPKGNIALWEGVRGDMEGALQTQRATIKGKGQKLKSSEELSGKMEAEDQKSKGKADEALKSEEVKGVEKVTSNTFLKTVVGGGAGIAKAGAAVVNFVGGLFGADEPVIDTKAIDNVQKLFSTAPKVASGKGKMGAKAGDLGSTGKKTKGIVDEKKGRLAKAEAKHQGAAAGTQKFGEGVKKNREEVTGEKKTQKKWVAKVREDLILTKQARQNEEANFNGEMGAMQLWAVQHYQVRQMNRAVMTTAGQVPTQNELDAPTAAKRDKAVGRIGESVADLTSKRSKISGIAKAGASQVITESGLPMGGAHQAEAQKAVAAFTSKTEGHLTTLRSMEKSLQTINPTQLPAALEAAEKTIRAIELAVARIYDAYVSAIGEVVNGAVEANAYEMAAKKRAIV